MLPWPPAQSCFPPQELGTEGAPKANSTQGSHAEKSPGLRIIDACSDLHKPQIKMHLRLARGLKLLPLSLLGAAESFGLQPHLQARSPRPHGRWHLDVTQSTSSSWRPTGRRARGRRLFLFPLAQVSCPSRQIQTPAVPPSRAQTGISLQQPQHNANLVPALP